MDGIEPEIPGEVIHVDQDRALRRVNYDGKTFDVRAPYGGQCLTFFAANNCETTVPSKSISNADLHLRRLQSIHSY